MNYFKSGGIIKNFVKEKTVKFFFLTLLFSSFLFSQQQSCDLFLCANLKSVKEVLSEGDRISFGLTLATLEGFIEPINQTIWEKWYNKQYGIKEQVQMVRYIYDKPVNNKTLVIETIYNKDHGEFLFVRVLYQREYENVMNFILKRYYNNTRIDFDSKSEFVNNSDTKYYVNADVLLKSLTRYIESL